MKFNSFNLFILTLFLGISACKKNESQGNLELEKISLSYAKGFEISKGDDFWVLEVSQPWTGADQTFRYLVLEENSKRLAGGFDAVIQLPVEKIILTSTTQIPHLDLLDATEKIIAFPNLDLISSEKVWNRIAKNQIVDLGSAPSANVEMMLDLEPDWVMISTLGEDLRNLKTLKNSEISTPINGEYVEQHPLGRAEWIKFTGVLLGKFEESVEVFEEVEKDYLEALSLVDGLDSSAKPSVLSGVLYQDIWFAPGSESWGAQILENAGGKYIFEDLSGTGSLELNYEYVLDEAMETDFWIGSADFESLEAMGKTEPRYQQFEAFKVNQVYTYTGKKGPKGGLEYFELGYMRPDLVLKDLIKILHPELLPDYELYFYKKLDEN